MMSVRAVEPTEAGSSIGGQTSMDGEEESGENTPSPLLVNSFTAPILAADDDEEANGSHAR